MMVLLGIHFVYLVGLQGTQDLLTGTSPKPDPAESQVNTISQMAPQPLLLWMTISRSTLDIPLVHTSEKIPTKIT